MYFIANTHTRGDVKIRDNYKERVLVWVRWVHEYASFGIRFVCVCVCVCVCVFVCVCFEVVLPRNAKQEEGEGVEKH